MTIYPQSVDVSAGQPTAAAHYNHLRADALRLGQAAGDAAALGILLGSYASGLTLVKLDADRVRVPAAPDAAVCVVVDGCPLCNTSHADLPLSGRPSSANLYHVFAVRSPGSSTFTIEANTSPAESSGKRRIGQFYFDGAQVQEITLQTAEAILIETLLRLTVPQACRGRLTLQPGVPVPAQEIPSAAAVFFSPYQGNTAALFHNAGGWRLHSFTELSYSLEGVPAGSNLDLFLSDHGDGLALTGCIWADDATRQEELAVLDGVPVRSGDPGQRYLGTVRTHAAGLTRSTLQSRLVWNAQQRVPLPLRYVCPTQLWSWNQAAWRQANNDPANAVEVVHGLPEALTDLTLTVVSRGQTHTGRVGIGINSASEPAVEALTSASSVSTAYVYGCGAAHLLCQNQQGYLNLRWLERTRSTVTEFFGSDPDYSQSGFSGWMMG